MALLFQNKVENLFLLKIDEVYHWRILYGEKKIVKYDKGGVLRDQPSISEKCVLEHHLGVVCNSRHKTKETTLDGSIRGDFTVKKKYSISGELQIG